VLANHGLEQRQLAEVMGVKVDRVKSLVLERATKLRAEELDRLVAAYGLPRAWLVDGSEPAPAGYTVQAARPADRQSPLLGQSHATAEPPPRPYHPSTSATDAQLLQQVVDATAAALTARGLQLPPQRRLRLYWAVFEFSLADGRVNLEAIPRLIQLAEGTR
jgi:hypothetical protein